MGGDTPQWLFYMKTVFLKIKKYIHVLIDFHSADICIILKSSYSQILHPFGFV